MSKRDNQLTIPIEHDFHKEVAEKAEKKGLSKAAYARMKLKEAV